MGTLSEPFRLAAPDPGYVKRRAGLGGWALLARRQPHDARRCCAPTSSRPRPHSVSCTGRWCLWPRGYE